jgi:hypothetical protein
MKAFNVQLFNAQTGAFDLGSVTIPYTFDVGYYRNARTGNFILTLIADNKQRIEVLPAFFRKMTGISPRTVCGRYDFNRSELLRLGFVLPKEVPDDARLICAN